MHAERNLLINSVMYKSNRQKYTFHYIKIYYSNAAMILILRGVNLSTFAIMSNNSWAARKMFSVAKY